MLLVEDDPGVAYLMGELLHGLGLDVSHAPQVERARTMAGATVFDLIVTDLVTTGSLQRRWEQVEALREAARGTPVLVVSGLGGAADEGAARGFAVLAKPFDVEEFEGAVRGTLAPSTG